MDTELSETYREYKLKYMKKNCVSSWLFTKRLYECVVRRTRKGRAVIIMRIWLAQTVSSGVWNAKKDVAFRRR